jgi:hypothetical protein
MWEGAISRVMAADRPYGEFMIFTASVRNVLSTFSYFLERTPRYLGCCTGVV